MSIVLIVLSYELYEILSLRSGPNQYWLPRGNDREATPQEECGKSLELKRFLSLLPSCLPIIFGVFKSQCTSALHMFVTKSKILCPHHDFKGWRLKNEGRTRGPFYTDVMWRRFPVLFLFLSIFDTFLLHPNKTPAMN